MRNHWALFAMALQIPASVITAQESADVRIVEMNVFATDGNEGGVRTFDSIDLGDPDSIIFSGRDASDASGLMDLLRNELIRQEIELVDEQYDQMKTFQELKQHEMSKAIRELISQRTQDPNSAAAFKERLDRLQTQAKTELEDMLLPHQIDRLRQVSRRVSMRQRGTAAALLQGSLAEELGITDKQRKELNATAKSIQDRIKTEVERLRDEGKKELMAILTPEQKEKLESLLGDEFDYKKPERLDPRTFRSKESSVDKASDGAKAFDR